MIHGFRVLVRNDARAKRWEMSQSDVNIKAGLASVGLACASWVAFLLIATSFH
jgi:hypothetical protein